MLIADKMYREREMHKAICADCKKECEVSFKPSGDRPVYCKACWWGKQHERVEKGDIKEYWTQKYVRENYKKLGFSKIEGPFETGPDFKGVYKGKKVIAEVEGTCESYIKHGHHEDTRFKDVNALIVLRHSEPTKDIKNKLPKTIIRINIDDFIEWRRPKAKAYAKTKRIQSIIDSIAGEFQKRFIAYCDDKDREMSTCPECDLCPYFGEGTAYEAGSIFRRMALKFIALYKYPITSDDFKLTNIEPSEIDKFYFGFLHKFFPL